MLVAFVCTGNICRSPIAETIARARHAAPDVEFASAGTWTAAGASASRWAIEVMAAVGIDIGSHTTRDLVSVMQSEPDAVYVMTLAHREHVRHAYPDLADRVSLLDPDGDDIPDPYGGDRTSYEIVRELISSAVSRRAPDWIL